MNIQRVADNVRAFYISRPSELHISANFFRQSERVELGAKIILQTISDTQSD